VAGVILAIHNARPAKLTSNTPTNLNMGGIYTITVPCLASKPSGTYNPPGNFDPIEYTSSCSTNIPNNIVGADSNGDSYNGLPPSISYNLSSYTNGAGGAAMSYNPELNVPGCNTSNHFLTTINSTQFDICILGKTSSAYDIKAIALNGSSEAQIEIWAGFEGNNNLPSNALSDLYSTLRTFQFTN